ncbi:MAG: hypothetical protein QMD46_02045 [Methanomicrobiales archaeon]|nr:hypothetical protein [Methanomicrobiales archaeon]
MGLIILQIITVLLLAGVVLEAIVAVYLAKIHRKLDLAAIPPLGSSGMITTRPPPEAEGAEMPESVDLIQGFSSMTESIRALAGKYGLQSFTLATQDGLVVASSSPGNQEDAAIYSHLFTKGEKPDDPLVQLFGIRHRGSSLIGIVKAHRTIPESWMKSIEEDVKIILGRWL